MDFYNDTEPFACDWMRNLMAAGEIPQGTVDDRSIKDLQPKDLEGYQSCHFFAGVAGWPEALRLAGWPVESVPVWTGSCPCQPYSAAGKGEGDNDERNLWPEFYRLIRECRPCVIFGEQVENAIGFGWLDGISADLEREGYAVGPCVLGAHSVGSPQRRQRLFWSAVGMAHTGSAELRRWTESQRQHRGTLHVADRSDISRMAFPESTGIIGHNRDMERKTGETRITCDGRNDGAIATSCGATDGVANAASPRHTGARRESTADGNGANPVSQRGFAFDELAGSGETGGLGDTGSERREGEAGGRFQPWEFAPSGAWDDYRIVQCRDGKARRVGCGILPLAYGISRDLGSSKPELRSLLKGARGNRTGRLRGYGNAICPQVAAVFIRALMETLLDEPN